MRVAVLGLIAAIALAAASAATAGPREVIDECVKAAPADDDTTGLDDLETECPGLTGALDALGVGALLPDDTREGLTRGTLKRAVALASPKPAVSAAPLSRASLDRILPTLGGEKAPESWWERFKAWLRARWGGGKAEPGSQWLQKWLESWKLSEVVASIVFYTLSALIIAVAIGIVVNEMRASGVFGPVAASTRRRAGSEVRRRGAHTLAEVAAAPLERRAALLFELVVQRLSDSGRLGVVRDRTHRELRLEAPFTDATDAERFARLAEIAEAQLFSPTPVAEGRLRDALADGEALVDVVGAPDYGHQPA